MRLLTFLFLLVSSIGFCQDKKSISLEDIYTKNTFRAEAVAGFRSMKDGRYYSEIASDGNLQKVRFADGQIEKIILNTKNVSYQNQAIKIDDYAFNNDESKILLFTESENIYRRSVLYKVFAYDIATKKVQLISSNKILHASFSPQSDKVAYVYENNLYFVDLNTEETIAVTNDGKYNIINGNCDWVYEEEFEFTKAYEWDKEGNYLAYYRFDQTLVPEYNFAQYDNLYPNDYRYKYPKAGEANSKIEIYIYQLESERTIRCDIGTETDIYIPRIKINKFRNSLIVYRANRLQNHLDLLEVNPKNGRSTIIYEETNQKFIEINDNLQFLENRDAFIYTSEKDGYNHLYLHSIASNSSSQITKGDWDVVSLLGIDEKNSIIYYLSSEISPMERNLFSIEFNGESKLNLTPDKGWHDIYLSRSFDFFMDKYSYLNTPPVYTIKNSKGNLVRTLKDNQSLKTKMLDYDLAKVEFIQVPNNEGVQLNGWIMKPTNFDPNKKYPLLMFQYSGPGSQQVMNQFGIRDYWWHQMLTQKGYIIVCVDGTGTGFRGESFKKKTYLQLGNYESDDQIAVAKYFAKQTYIDALRIGIWGWSYGGFMSSICLFKGADVFKSAIAVAPVTNWRYYDNIYTERYMRTPQENPKGYDDNSPVNMVNQLKGNFLLIHGTADDNVHYQNSLMMVDAMIKANKDFDSEFYPNKNHGISGGNTRYHLYKRMTHFILEKL
jgi:dipeptidyl-peptidase-4